MCLALVPLKTLGPCSRSTAQSSTLRCKIKKLVKIPTPKITTSALGGHKIQKGLCTQGIHHFERVI